MAGGPGPRPEQLIFDSRFPAARAAAAAAARHGVATSAFAGDVTALWFHDLGPRWAATRAPLAGITSAATLFCLEQLARDAWMRVTVRAEHGAGGIGGHRVSGRAADVARICAALDGAHDWPTRVGLALTAPAVGGAADRRERLVGRFGGSRDAAAAVLVSWIIAA